MSYDPAFDRQPHPADSMISGLRAENEQLQGAVEGERNLRDKLAAALNGALDREGRLRAALKPFAQTGWMTSDTEHTARTVVAHMHPESQYEIILSSEDFRRAARACEQKSDTREVRGMEHIQITAQAVAEAIAIERKKTAAEIGRLQATILWALGETPDAAGNWFGYFLPGDAKALPYWWRTPLRKMAGILEQKSDT